MDLGLHLCTQHPGEPATEQQPAKMKKQIKNVKRIHYILLEGGGGAHASSAYLDMEFSDVMSFGDRIALKLRLGWDTAVNRRENRPNYQ